MFDFRKLVFAASLAVTITAAHADDIFQNGDFSQGTTGWKGRFEQAPPDPNTPTGGLTVQLQPHKWTTLSQDIEVNGHRLHFVMVYSLSADAKFTDDAGDLAVAGSEAGLKNWSWMDSRPGFAGIYLEGDGPGTNGMIPFQPKLGTTEKQTVRNPFGFREDDNKRFFSIAFPPGTGTVTIYQVKGDVSPTDANPYAAVDNGQAAAATPAGGTEILDNADLNDGTLHWTGDCKAAGSDSTTDFVANGASPKGIMVDLRSSTWTMVKQEMRNAKAGMSRVPMRLEVDYQVSSDFSLSDRGSDYSGDTKSGISGLLGFPLAKITGSPGQILVFIDTPPENRGVAGNGGMLVYFDHVSGKNITPGSGGAKTFTDSLTMPSLNGTDNPTFCIAIPPGSGSISFTKISLQSPQ
jgi:hypothetical protein